MTNGQYTIKLHNSGFSIIEIIVAFAVFSTILATLTTSLTYMIRQSKETEFRKQADFYALEGIEAARNIRDQDFTNLSDGQYGLSYTGSGWVLNGSNNVLGDYTRSITISTLSPSSKQIVSTVDWSSNIYANGSSTFTSRLLDWQNVSTPPDSNVFRVTEYFVASGEFSGNTYNLTLAEDLSSDYYIIMQGSDGDGSSTRGPDENYAQLTHDPFGTGELSTSSNSRELRFRRDNSQNSWVGVVSVVECLEQCDTKGFSLLDARLLDHAGTSFNGNETTQSWTDINQIVPFGGFNASGCFTAATSANDHKSCHVRFYPTGTNTINWERDDDAAYTETAQSTVHVIEWGSEWNIQHVTVSGNNGGGGIDSTGEYNTGSISPVNRDDTFVWGTGFTNDNGIGDAAEAVVITLGNGVTQNTTESLVAVGMEYTDTKTFDVYALTHDDLAVNYAFKTDGDSGNVIVDITIPDSGVTNKEIMAIGYNTCNGTGTAYPRPMFSYRHLDDTTIRMERRRSGQNFVAWVQGIDFGDI